jgi:hypothetical protein
MLSHHIIHPVFTGCVRIINESDPPPRLAPRLNCGKLPCTSIRPRAGGYPVTNAFPLTVNITRFF